MTDIEREQSDPFDFNLRVKEVKPQPTRGSSSENSPDIEPTLPVIQALQQYIADKKHVFLVGQPGAGKTKTLLRYLLELVEQAKGDSSAKIPILVQLKDYKVPSDDYSGIVHLIRKDLEESWGLSLELAEIQQYLFQEPIFLLLVDGLNELSTSKEAWKDIRQFWDRCHKRQISIVFTTRGLGYRNLGIKTQLEIQSIAPKDRQRFLEERVLPGDRQKLQGWLNRARQSDYTPFVMWMLTTVCQQVNSSSQLESFSIGEAFREFVRLYQDRLYEEGRISDEDGEEWVPRLENLASEMMSDERAENFVISRVTAIEIIGSESLLNNLIRHHLLVESRGKGEIVFCHQLLQEYYVAEWLRRNLPDFLKDENSGKRFQHDYLNYLKWTEPIAIMLGLPEITETHAIKIIELALDVDLMLGVRLAGEVKPQFQEQTIELVSVAKLFDEAEVSDWLQIELVGRTRSKLALPKLRQFLKHSNIDIAQRAVAWIGFLGYQEAIPELLKALRHYYPSDDSSESVEIPFKVQEDFIVTIRGMTYETLNNLGDNEAIEAWLLERNSRKVREQVADALGRFNTEEVIRGLFSSLHKGVKAAAVPLGKLGKQEVVPELIELLQDPSQISSNNKVIDTLVSLGNLEIVSQLISILKNINDYSHTDFYFKNRVAIVLAGVEHQAMASYLPDLVKLLPTEVGEQVSWAIDAIQSRYGFYNYGIDQQAKEANNLGFEYDFIRGFYEDIDKVIYQIQENPELRQNDTEDRLTIDIVNQLRNFGYNASHDTKSGGHVDITVRKNGFLWLGEAKIYKDNNYLWEGFLQLTTRYSSGDSNQEHGGLLIYIRDEDASSIMEKWQNYLLEKSLADYSFRPCHIRSLAFISTHRHERSGQAFHVRHIPVMLHFAPKDRSGRRRKESP
ncbi:NACHT domain-containing protein [Coleofasciculus sp. F4-SAH-05]|uniref:NACHT domain-containing protein n=1 Tax=Coleofasciculus sp. F4-SAH-05 TaxID=3069525 RepID=UPI0033025DD2